MIVILLNFVHSLNILDFKFICYKNCKKSVKKSHYHWFRYCWFRSAIRLSSKGYLVTVYESNSYVGGKISEIRKNGYRFDTGPSLFTMPNLIDELVSIGNINSAIKFEYKKIDTTCSYFFDDGIILNAYSDQNRFADELVNKLDVDSKIITKYLSYVAFLFKSTHKIFIEKSLHKLSTYFSFNTLVSFFKIPFLSIFKTMHKVNTNRLKNDKLIKIFNRYDLQWIKPICGTRNIKCNISFRTQ